MIWPMEKITVNSDSALPHCICGRFLRTKAVDEVGTMKNDPPTNRAEIVTPTMDASISGAAMPIPTAHEVSAIARPPSAPARTRLQINGEIRTAAPMIAHVQATSAVPAPLPRIQAIRKVT